MKSVKAYNALHGKVVKREKLQEILEMAKEDGHQEIIVGLSGALQNFPDKTFEITIDNKATTTGLGAPRHSGLAKEALDDCGRLKPGYKYGKDGKLVKIKKEPKDQDLKTQVTNFLKKMSLDRFAENYAYLFSADLDKVRWRIDNEKTHNEYIGLLAKKVVETKRFEDIGFKPPKNPNVKTKAKFKPNDTVKVEGESKLFIVHSIVTDHNPKSKHHVYRLYSIDKTDIIAVGEPKLKLHKLYDEKEKLKAKLEKIQKQYGLGAAHLPEITQSGLNGPFLADGHEIISDEDLAIYDDNVIVIGLGKAAKDVEAIVNELILDKIKTGAELPAWKKTWANQANIPAQNFVTKKPYTGSNSIILNVLLGSLMPTPYYLTSKQIEQLGGSIKKGSKSVPLVYYNFVYSLKDFTDKPDQERELLKKVEGFEIKRKGKKTITISRSNYVGQTLTEKEIQRLNLDDKEYWTNGYLRYYRVFNVADTTGIEYTTPGPTKRTTAERIKIAEAILKSFTDKPKILHDPKDAKYNIKDDLLYIPNIEEFDSSEEYYSTLFHELVHSTMHEKRLDRKAKYKGKEQKAQYAFEELIAELGASYLCGIAGILDATHLNQASYLKGWHEKLQALAKSNTDFFVFATKEAQKAVDYIIRNFDENKIPELPKPKSNDKAKAQARAKALKLKLKLKVK